MEINWKDLMLRFMKCVGETNEEWYPELWESYGISKEEAREMINEYEKKYNGHERE